MLFVPKDKEIAKEQIIVKVIYYVGIGLIDGHIQLLMVFIFLLILEIKQVFAMILMIHLRMMDLNGYGIIQKEVRRAISIVWTTYVVHMIVNNIPALSLSKQM